MGFEVPSDFQKRFYRLQYTNQEVAIDHNLDDFDGDGFTNLEEVFANTNPILSQSHPPTTDDEPEGGPGDEEGQGFQLIHIVNGVSIFYSYEAGSSIPVFPIYRGAGMTNELKVVGAPPNFEAHLLEIVPNDDFDYESEADSVTNPKFVTKIFRLTPVSFPIVRTVQN